MTGPDEDLLDAADCAWSRHWLSDEEEREADRLAEQNLADEHLAYLLELNGTEVNNALHADRNEERGE